MVKLIGVETLFSIALRLLEDRQGCVGCGGLGLGVGCGVSGDVWDGVLWGAGCVLCYMHLPQTNLR